MLLVRIRQHQRPCSIAHPHGSTHPARCASICISIYMYAWQCLYTQSMAMPSPNKQPSQPAHCCLQGRAYAIKRPCSTSRTPTAKKYTFIGRPDKKLTRTYQFWQTQNGTNSTTDKNCTLEMTKNSQPMPPKNSCHAFLCTATHFQAADTPVSKLAQRLHIDRQ